MTRRAILAFVLLFATPAGADVRIKDIAAPIGPRDYQLVGYGLVIGLQGTGDTLRNAPFTEQSTSALLDRMGVNVRPNNSMRTRNVAAVMVTAALPPFASWGTTIDVTVSSMGDATSLMGGTLVLTSLTGIDGAVYALAQGPIAVSGFSAQGQNETLTHGVATVGRIPNGATIEREAPRPSVPNDGQLVLQLRNPDYTTSVRVADAVNRYARQRYRMTLARERDDRSVLLALPKGAHATRLLAEIGELRVAVETPARVVIDERTGTVVIGADVQISSVAVTHGGLTVRITETPEISQPAPFANGRTTVTTQTTISAAEQTGQVAMLAGPTLKQLVKGLNQIGLKPTGVISILQAIKSAGALQADLVIQ
ncbi:flagellar basal body P-ring protein FlgI [Methylocystis parvus OBBP]|uniref:Flagellar P-ring protein n=2 Tax=Methylocystis parvus TaxID=134 RepID=A0A6B8M7E1_9HYPH|nr:flagellar basal body P-ring protein FlgI [Methylocystis parvus]QGM97912.1 flagellar basal body P-ring protein FlgI [Methylocystis parvus]WBK01776.1 flagellar basal body P-ring protein FlgI [Methylocystis parvus OBBP]